MPGDDVIMYHSPFSVTEFVNVIADWAEARRHKFVFKVHPGCKDEVITHTVDRRVRSSRYLFCRADNIHSLINESRGVITINSGVGFESLIHGKPVATLGDCDYRCVTYPAEEGTLDAALDYIDSYTQEQREAAACFIYFYFRQHGYTIASEEIDRSKERVKAFLKDRLTPSL